jgi:hypothetical protein
MTVCKWTFCRQFVWTITLPIIKGALTYPEIAAILKEIKANAASVPSAQGGGSNGCLA